MHCTVYIRTGMACVIATGLYACCEVRVLERDKNHTCPLDLSDPN